MRFEEPDQILTTLTNSIPFILYLVRKYTVMLAIKLIDASFSNVSFPAQIIHNKIPISPDENIQI